MKITVEQLKQLIQQEVAKAKGKLYYWEDNGQPKQFKNNTKVVEGKKEMSEQAVTRSHPDLSKVEGSFAHWLEHHFKEINDKKLYAKKNDLIQYIKDAREKDSIKVSDKYLEKFFEKINMIKRPEKVLEFLYNAYLKGSNLDIHESKEPKNESKKIKKNNSGTDKK